MRAPTWALAALAGVAVGTAFAWLPGTWAALAIGAGAMASALALAVVGSGRKYYSAAGSAYCVGLGLLALAGALPVPYGDSPAVALLSLGLASAAVVAAIYAGERVLERRAAGRGGWRGVLRRGLTAVALVRLARSGFAAGRLALYVGTLALVGAATFALDAVGVAVPIPWVGGRIDAVVLAFVAAVLVGFHGLAAAHTTLLAARGVAGTAREVGRRIAARDDDHRIAARDDDHRIAARDDDHRIAARDEGSGAAARDDDRHPAGDAERRPAASSGTDGDGSEREE